MAELVDALKFGFSNSQKIERGPPYRNSTGPRLSFLRGEHMDKEIRTSDIVKLTYISTNDPLHKHRARLLHRTYKIVMMMQKPHPNLAPYRGGDNWYKAILVGTESNESIELDLCQLRKVKEAAPEPDLLFGDDYTEKVVHSYKPNLGELNFKLKMERRKKQHKDLEKKPYNPFDDDFDDEPMPF